jgi:hypothetical protein
MANPSAERWIMMHRLPTLSLAGSAALLATLTLAGCSEAETPAVCSSVDSLTASVTDLTSVNIDQGALKTLQDNFTRVRSDLSKVKSDAKEEYATEIDALDQAASSVSSSLDAATAAPSVQTVTAVGVAVESLGTSLTALEDAVSSTC